MLELNEYLRLTVGLLALVGPLSTLPLFLDFTANIPSQRQRIAKITGIAVACILALSVVAGALILRLFGISIDSFRVAGGLLLMTIALSMLEARTNRTKQTPEEEQDAIDNDSIAVVPLALPMVAGPGAISTVIVFSALSVNPWHKLTMIIICCLLSVLVWFCFHMAPYLVKHISQTSMNIVSRVMGLILAAMAVEFIISGLKNLMPGLSG